MTLADALRWAARLTGSFVVGLVLVLVFQTEAFALDFSEPAVLVQVSCLAVVVGGIVVGWRNESLGGSLILLGLALFLSLIHI